MTIIYLPTDPAPSRINPRPVKSVNEMMPSFQGPDQRAGRMGSRTAYDVQMPPMSYEEAMEWGGIDDEAATVVLPLIQPEIDLGAPGAPVIDGGGQTGSFVLLRGLTPHYYFRPRQWISMILSGQRFAYRVSQTAVADANGKLALPLMTVLRKPVTDGAVVEVADPKIEGYPTPTEDCWAIGADDFLVRLAFTIRERE